MLSWPDMALESPLGPESGSELQESGRLQGCMGLRQLRTPSLKEAWLNPVATAEWRCHQMGTQPTQAVGEKHLAWSLSSWRVHKERTVRHCHLRS